jgi:hypothetical protein
MLRKLLHPNLVQLVGVTVTGTWHAILASPARRDSFAGPNRVRPATALRAVAGPGSLLGPP